jgi:nucleoside-diphosphate-sugar epimerase|tara:strand:+ start:2481 stop:3314 length:834 start_codon:yes stop_codon:yes gene_type:complete
MDRKSKILVTGSKGFLGGHTIRYMQDQGHTVTGIDQDIFKDGLPNEHFDVMFHFAAFVGGRKGIDNNLYKVARNIDLDRITFEWAETHVNKLIYPSSCAAYPKSLQTQHGTPMREDMAGGETFDIYGMTKLMAEAMLRFSKIPCHIMRPFTIYGPGQSMDYPLPAIIQRAKSGECSVWGSGTQVRDWVHIDDALKVFDYLVHRDDPIVLNIGTGIPLTFKEVAQIIYNEVHGEYSLNLQTQTDQPEGAGYRYADITLLKSLGLEPKISLAEGIRTML